MLKKSLFAMTLAGSIFASEATLPKGRLDKLNANYRSPRGSGTAEYININDFGEYTKPTLEMENYNGLLIFSVEDKSFELDLSMLGVTDADQIKLSNLNFSNNSKTINLNLAGASAVAETVDTNIRSASISCSRDREFDDITDDLLSACLKQSQIRANSFRFKGQSEFESLVESGVTASDMTIDNLKININNHSLKGELKSNLSKGMKVKFEGSTIYDINQKRIALKISKAKAGIFSVKGTIFKELRKIESQSIEVREPYIYIYMQDN